MKIGVFDSGIGGQSVVAAIEKAMPETEVIFMTDKANFPYAAKSPEQIWQAVLPIFEQLTQLQVEAIVIACNTVSTTLSDRLRNRFPQVPMIALDPMLKPAAAATKSGIIAACATPTTLASDRYQQLKRDFASDVQVLEPDCSDWSYLIENNQMNEQRIQDELQPALDAGADVIVLACTHYHWIQTEIETLAAGRATVLQPEIAIVVQLKKVLHL